MELIRKQIKKSVHRAHCEVLRVLAQCADIVFFPKLDVRACNERSGLPGRVKKKLQALEHGKLWEKVSSMMSKNGGI